MNVKVTNDHIYIQLPAAMKSYTENVLNGIYSKKENAHRFPKNYHAMVEVLQAFPDLQHNETFVETGKNLNGARRQCLDLKSISDIDWRGFEKLRPYQRVDLNYLRRIPSAGIFNEPRTGKTPTSIMLIKQLQTKRNLIVCPASLIYNWANEFEKWYPEIPVMIYQANKKNIAHPAGFEGVVIVSKDTLKNHITKFNDYMWDAVFVDEAHFLRNYKTLQSKAIFQIEAKRRYALTGTPTVKHAVDVWGILHFLYPTKFNSYWQFAERYFEIGQDFLGHMQVLGVKKNREQELKELIGFMSVQRKRKEVMEWLPDKQYINIPVEMNDKQKKLYTQMAEDFITQLDDTVVDTSGILPQLMRLRQICLDPRLVGFDVKGAKTENLLEWLDDNREPVVIMSMFTSYLKLLKPEIEKLGLKVGMIHGEMSNKEKMETATEFQGGHIDILLCNIISAGTGFTLDKSETIIFTDKAFNPAENLQAQDRILPTTEQKNHKIDIITFSCRNSFDERINGILDNKKTLTDVVNEGGREAIQVLLR